MLLPFRNKLILQKLLYSASKFIIYLFMLFFNFRGRLYRWPVNGNPIHWLHSQNEVRLAPCQSPNSNIISRRHPYQLLPTFVKDYRKRRSSCAVHAIGHTSHNVDIRFVFHVHYFN